MGQCIRLSPAGTLRSRDVESLHTEVDYTGLLQGKPQTLPSESQDPVTVRLGMGT
uniref:Uncharacterized protein n=1 Tax=Otolemur garnettii TaxID=30611 RepID=H0XM11_OTOGA